ncbi:hypothetical protein BGX29_007169, partial [Mortierella sp. GBA35]
MPPRIPVSVLFPRAQSIAERTEAILSSSSSSSISSPSIPSSVIINNSSFPYPSLSNEGDWISTTRHDDVSDKDQPLMSHKERIDQDIAAVANWLSLFGSLLIILHIPRVVRQVPSQKKRMLIILFTAISNIGFALANIITDYTDAVAQLPCTISAWCYVFFQLLTCTLVIVGTFRLCGVFLFQRRRSFPSKYVAICPAIAFLLATPPAISGNFDFNECGHYCWFRILPEQQDCKVRSLWAWLTFYGPMLLFLAILFGSTLFVMIKIAFSVTHSRSDLKQVINQSTLESILADSPPLQSASPFQRLRSMCYTIQNRTASIFSFRSRRRGTAGAAETIGTAGTSGSPSAATGAGAGTGNGTATRTSLTVPGGNNDPAAESTINFHPNLEGVVLPSTAELAAIASPPPTTQLSLQAPFGDTLEQRGGSQTRSTSPNVPRSSFPAQEVGLPGRKERSFVVAILRQALYPISISLSGCVQIFVDLTISQAWNKDDELGYAANVATSIQGFLFFLVFLFDPAVIQTRRSWRKYMVWRYYIEFYYSLEMPHEGREFETRFMQKCQEQLGPATNQAKHDQLTRPPAYSWSLQYDNLAMPTDFQTSYPLSAAINSTPTYVSTLSRMEQGEEDTKTIAAKKRPSQQRGEARGGDSMSEFTQTVLPTQIAEVDEGEFISPTTPSRPPPAIMIMGSGGESSGSTMVPIDYTRTASDPASETTVTTSNTTNTTNITNNSTSTSSNTTSEGTTTPIENTTTSPADEDIRIYPMSRMTALAALHASYQSEASINTFQDLDIERQDERIYLDKDMDTDRNVRRIRNREATLKAPYAGDVLQFSRLSKVRTIGGSDGTSPRRYRNSGNLLGGGGGRGVNCDSNNNANGNSTTLPRSSLTGQADQSEQRRSLGESLLSFIQGGHWNSNSAEGRYQTRFKYPRLAYLIHRIIRVVYIPKKVRLPPIPDPFARRRPSVRDLYERRITRESAVLPARTSVLVQPPLSPPAPCQDAVVPVGSQPDFVGRPVEQFAGLGLEYSTP